MRDRTKAAYAALRSQIYRDAQPTFEARLGPEASSPRPAAGGGHPRMRKGSAALPHLTAVSLLGLLDLFKGG